MQNIKKYVRKIIKIFSNWFLLFVLPSNKYVIFESGNYFYDNSYYLYKYLDNSKIKRFYICFTEKQYLSSYLKGVEKEDILLLYASGKYPSFNNEIKNICKNAYIVKKSKIIFITYENFVKQYKFVVSKRTSIINLRHEQYSVKTMKDYYAYVFKKNTKLLTRISTPELVNYMPSEIKAYIGKWFVGGAPRNDSLKNDKYSSFKRLLGDEINLNKERIILCATTWRTRNENGFFNGDFPLKMDQNDIKKLSNALENNNYYMLVKTHHMNSYTRNDVDKLFSSRIIIKSQDDFENNNLFINEIFKYTSALITDFSSIVCDYFLVNKPVAYLLSDMEKYNDKIGFQVNIDNIVAGRKIYTLDELIMFIDNVDFDNKKWAKKRRELSLLFNGNYLNNCEQIARLFLKHSLIKKT